MKFIDLGISSKEILEKTTKPTQIIYCLYIMYKNKQTNLNFDKFYKSLQENEESFFNACYFLYMKYRTNFIEFLQLANKKSIFHTWHMVLLLKLNPNELCAVLNMPIFRCYVNLGIMSTRYSWDNLFTGKPVIDVVVALYLTQILTEEVVCDVLCATEYLRGIYAQVYRHMRVTLGLPAPPQKIEFEPIMYSATPKHIPPKDYPFGPQDSLALIKANMLA